MIELLYLSPKIPFIYIWRDVTKRTPTYVGILFALLYKALFSNFVAFGEEKS